MAVIIAAMPRLRESPEMLRVTRSGLARRLRLDRSLGGRPERGRIATWPRFRPDAAEALGIDEHLLLSGQEQ